MNQIVTAEVHLIRFEAAVEKFTKAIARLEQVIRDMPQPTGFTVVVMCQACFGKGKFRLANPPVVCPGCHGAGVQRI